VYDKDNPLDNHMYIHYSSSPLYSQNVSNEIFTDNLYINKWISKLQLILSNSQGPEVDLKPDSLSLKAHGTGVRGHNVYSFDIKFCKLVDPKVTSFFALACISNCSHFSY